jgi:hypothetical protein
MKILIGIQTMLLLLAAAADDVDGAAARDAREHPAASSPCDHGPDAPDGADCRVTLSER